MTRYRKISDNVNLIPTDTISDIVKIIKKIIGALTEPSKFNVYGYETHAFRLFRDHLSPNGGSTKPIPSIAVNTQ